MQRMAAMLCVLGKSTVCRKPARASASKAHPQVAWLPQQQPGFAAQLRTRHRAGRRISGAFVESAANQLIDKRRSQSQQMGSSQRAFA
jgi:hypothetical protein